MSRVQKSVIQTILAFHHCNAFKAQDWQRVNRLTNRVEASPRCSLEEACPSREPMLPVGMVSKVFFNYAVNVVSVFL
jgi:hypothetical protein